MRQSETCPQTRRRLLVESGLFDAGWYTARNADHTIKGTDPLTHFLSIGWDLGRDPGPGFDTNAYLATYADVATSGMGALTHFLLHGAAEGRDPNPFDSDPIRRSRARSDVLRTRLNVLGQRSALQGLKQLATEEQGNASAFACRDLALWHLRQWRVTADAQMAIQAAHWALKAVESAVDMTLKRRLVTVVLVAKALAKQDAPTEQELLRWAGQDALDPDHWMALTGFESAIERRVTLLNQALRAQDLAPVELLPDTRLPGFDRLSSQVAPGTVTGPLVSVLIAAFQAENTLATSLRAMTAQSWKNLEIIVIDDASTDRTAEIAETAARSDPRIRLIRQDQNGGAYATRNSGLAVAQGAFVTIHDADDWCHPERIARQMALLTEGNGVIACTSEHVRVQSDLILTRLSPEAHFLTENPASLLFQRAPVVDALGGWDTIRVAADNEFIRRMRTLFGFGSVLSEKTGPLAFLRDHEGSAVRDGPLAIDGYVTGARLAYLDAQDHFHRNAPATSLRYVPGDRPFPVPEILRLQKRGQAAMDLSVILAADLRHSDHVVETCLQIAAASAGPVGLVSLARTLSPDLVDLPHRLCPTLRQAVDGTQLVQLCAGEAAEAPLLVLPDPEALADLPDPLPRLNTARVRLLAYHAPSTILAGTGRKLVRYDPAQCEAAARQLSAGSLEWWALTPDIRKSLLESGATRIARRRLKASEPWGILR